MLFTDLIHSCIIVKKQRYQPKGEYRLGRYSPLEVRYKRVILKLSGEALAGEKHTGFDEPTVTKVAKQVKTLVDQGIEVGIVIGGGNIFRGLSGVSRGFDRVKGDQMGMLATVINSLALQGALESAGARARVLTSIRMEPVGELYTKAKALELMEAGWIVIIAGGTGRSEEHTSELQSH